MPKPPHPPPPPNPSADGTEGERVPARASRDIPTSRLGRFARLSGLSTAVSSSYLGQRVKGMFQDEDSRARSLLETHTRNAARMVETLGSMKGAVMKVGQFLSMADSSVLPGEVAEALKGLQSTAPYLPWAQIRTQVESSLGASPEALFASFESEPAAAASLGQVHRAVTHDGVAVAVKVQYPGIDKTIRSDLRNLKSLVRPTVGMLSPADVDGIFAEVEEMLMGEVDYLKETGNLRAFREHYQGDPDVYIPQVFPELCSEKVVTMEWVEGLTLERLLSQDPSQAVRNRISRTLVRLLADQFLSWETLHADPQGGNYLFSPEGRVTLLDFGAVKRFPPEFAAAYRELSRAGLEGRREDALDVLESMRCWKPSRRTLMGPMMWGMTRLFLDPFLEDRPYTFGETNLPERGRQLSTDGFKTGATFHFSPPKDLIFLHRTIVGLYFVQSRIQGTNNYRELLLPLLYGDEGR